MTVVVDKQLLRGRMGKARDGYDSSWLAAKSALVCDHLMACPQWQEAAVVMGYLAFGNEVNIDVVLQAALDCGKRVLVPFMVSSARDGLMEAVEFVDFADVCLGRYGIRSVGKQTGFVDPVKIDLMLVPGLCFTRQGERLGMGAGYYDRFLARAVRAKRIGVTLSPQIVPLLPTDVYDARIDFLASEEGVFAC